MKRLQYLLFLSMICFALVSCDKDDDNDPDMSDCTPNVSWATQIKPIIDGNCIGCHDGPGGGPRDTDFRTYAGVKALAAGVKARTESRDMPRGGGSLTDAQIELIACWVDQGALDN